MEELRRIAYETVLRACRFGSLAIFCFMVGLSFEPRIAAASAPFPSDDSSGEFRVKGRTLTSPFKSFNYNITKDGSSGLRSVATHRALYGAVAGFAGWRRGQAETGLLGIAGRARFR